MDNLRFAHQVSAWLEPQAIINCAVAYDRDRAFACAEQTMFIANGELRSGLEGHFAELVKRFLEGFSVPPSVMELLEPVKNFSEISDEAWNWVGSLSVSAVISSIERDKGPPGVHPKTVLAVTERDAVLDLLRIPLLAMGDLVSHFAYSWRLAEKFEADAMPSIYYESKMPSEFLAYVEHKVASYYVNFVPLATHNQLQGIKNRYRATTVYGHVSSDDVTWEVARTAAVSTANSTFEPI